jgi:hypothetical protein
LRLLLLLLLKMDMKTAVELNLAMQWWRRLVSAAVVPTTT